jgi:protein MpaA
LSLLALGLLNVNSGESGERRWERQYRRAPIATQPCPPAASNRIGEACGVAALQPTPIPEKLIRPIPTVQPPAAIAAPVNAATVNKGAEAVHLGYSVKGIPILLQVFGHEGPVTLIFGAIHGSEPNSGGLARHLLDDLLEHPEIYAGRRVGIIPVANPDGLVRNQRLNEHKVDLNRNFPAANWAVSKAGPYHGGTRAGSEPETQAVIKSVELLNPQRIVSIHAISRGRECNNYDGPAAKLAELMKAKNGYRVAKTIGYPTPGSFGSWSGIDRQIPTITLELPHDLSDAESWKTHREALHAVIQSSL